MRYFSQRLLLLCENPYWAIYLASMCYTVLSVAVTQLTIFRPSKVAYYNYLADAFLHGQLNLRLIPFTTHDLVFFQGKYFLYWPPLPAILFVPFVALFGINFSDIFINIIIAGGNVGLIAYLLRCANEHKLVSLSALQRGCLVIFFAFGTVHVTLAPYGRVWATGQLLGFQFLLIAYIAAFKTIDRLAFVITGLALAATFLTRSHMIFAGIWPVAYLVHRHVKSKNGTLMKNLILLMGPIAAAVMLLGGYNLLRFGDPLENGLRFHLMANAFANDFQRYGVFSFHYVPRNLFYQYLAYPFPLNEQTFHGGSLFLLSPVFVGALWGIARDSQRYYVWLLIVSILLVQVPIVMVMGTGWIQFGPRYLLDITAPLLLLTAFGIQKWRPWVLYTLTLISMEHYLVGTVFLGRYLIALNNL